MNGTIQTFLPALKWYKNTARKNAEHALTMLAEAVDQGYWPKGYSRKVVAALRKTHRGLTDQASKEAQTVPSKLGYAHIDVDFGSFPNALRYTSPEALEGRPEFAKWVKDFTPIAEAVKTLDATRPKPVFFFKTLSKEVVENLGKHVGIDLSTIEAPEVRWDLVEGVDGSGKAYRYYSPTILWPEGTIHHASKFYHSGNNHQCQACGHAIKNSWNWVPLYGQTPNGPRSLWVGRDCAKKLFGVEVTGDAEFRKNETA